MLTVIIATEAAFFFIMGVVALVKPSFVTSVFKTPVIPADMRNEVRAVYGGFGLAMAAMLLVSLYIIELRDGVLITVGVALLGMAGGRLASFLIERTEGKNPAIFLLAEIALGGALIYAWSTSTA